MALGITDLLNIFTLSLAIASSSVAVMFSIFLRELFKSRQEQRRVKSMMIAYLHSVSTQLSEARSFFQLLSIRSSWTDTDIPQLLFSANAWALPIKTGFEEEIRRTILTLGNPLNRHALLFLEIIDEINIMMSVTRGMYVDLPPEPGLTKSQAITNRLRETSEFFKTLHEYATLVGKEALRLYDFLLVEEQFSVRLGKLFGWKLRVRIQYVEMNRLWTQAKEILRKKLDSQEAQVG